MKQAFGSALPVGRGWFGRDFRRVAHRLRAARGGLGPSSGVECARSYAHAARYITGMRRQLSGISAFDVRGAPGGVAYERLRNGCARGSTNFRFLPRLRWFARRRSVCLFLPEFVVGELEVEPAEPGEEGQSRALVRFTLESKGVGQLAPRCVARAYARRFGPRAASILRTKQSEIPKE